MKSMARATQESGYFYGYVGCKVGDSACLRAKSANDIVAAQVLTAKKITLTHPLEVFIPFTPVHYPHGPIPIQPMEAFEQGLYKKVPMMFGSVYQDGLLFIYRAAPNPVTDLQYVGVISLMFVEDAPKVLVRYPPSPIVGDKRPLLSDITTQWVFGCSNRYFLSQILYDNPNPIYFYVFNHSLSWKGWGPLYPYCEGKVCHGAELPYLFDPPLEGTGVQFNPAEVQMSANLRAMWTNFAKSGNPNKPVSVSPAWLPFTNATKIRMDIMAPTNKLAANYQGSECDFWDTIGYHHGW